MKTVALMIVIGGAAIGAQGGALSLASLTVQQDRLPAGCLMKSMRPPDKPATQVGATVVMAAQPLMYPSNPWSGTTTRLLVETRKGIDPPPSLYYDPPPAKASEMESQWVEHVVEAYHAIYDSADSSSVEVWAIRFDDPKLASATPSVANRMLSRSGSVDDGRIIKGDAVIKIAGSPTTDCFRTIDKYIRETR